MNHPKPKKRKVVNKLRHVHFTKGCPFDTARALVAVLRSLEFGDTPREKALRWALEEMGGISGVQFTRGMK